MIHAAILTVDQLQVIDTYSEIINFASASNHRLDVHGIIHLKVTVGSQTNRVIFVLVDQLGDDAILGFSYIDLAVEEGY